MTNDTTDRRKARAREVLCNRMSLRGQHAAVRAVRMNIPHKPTDNIISDMLAFADSERPRDGLADAVRAFLPSNLCLTNSDISDEMTVPLDATMGELRILAALSKGHDDDR